MAKVVTSQGLSDFVQTGTPTEVLKDKPQKLEKQAPALEIVGQTAPADKRHRKSRKSPRMG